MPMLYSSPYSSFVRLCLSRNSSAISFSSSQTVALISVNYCSNGFRQELLELSTLCQWLRLLRQHCDAKLVLHSEELKKAVALEASASNEKVKASDVGESSSLEDSALARPASDDSRSVAKIDRCSRCNKKVGLLKGFKCKCGSVYCMVHRYPEEHACMFDFKAAARAAIAKANPVIEADKLGRRV